MNPGRPASEQLWMTGARLSWCGFSSERRRRMMRGRRRQHLLAVCTLTVVVGFLRTGPAQLPIQEPPSGRRLMHATLQVRAHHIRGISVHMFTFSSTWCKKEECSFLCCFWGGQDNTEILGFSLGLLSFAIACTSRFPTILRTVCDQLCTAHFPSVFPNKIVESVVLLQHRGHILSLPGIFCRLLSSLAAALYAAAVLVCADQLGLLLKVMPWSLSAACCCALDLVVSLHATSSLSPVCGPRTTVLVQYEFFHYNVFGSFLLGFYSTWSDSFHPLAKETKETAAKQFFSRQWRKLRFWF